MNANTIALVLVCVGAALLLAELFIPDFGIIGITGAVSIVAAIIIYADGVIEAVVMLAIFAVFLAALFFVFVKVFNKNGSRIVLNAREDVSEGYHALRNDEQVLDKTGVAQTDLHPSGAALIDGKRIDVITSGEYIQKGEKVKVVHIEGRRILVEKEEEV